MFDIGFLELIVVAVVALVVFGPERLPKVARDAGRWVSRARRLVNQFSSEMERQLELDELREKLRKQGESLDIEKDVRQIEATVKDALSEALPPHSGEFEPLPRSEPDRTSVEVAYSPARQIETSDASQPVSYPDSRPDFPPDSRPDEHKQSS